MNEWEFLDTPESISREHELKMAERRARAVAIIFAWRRVFLRLERSWGSRLWQELFLRQRALLPDACKHDDPTMMRSAADNLSRHTACMKCENIVMYEHTKEGVIHWMSKYAELVRKEIVPVRKLPMERKKLHPAEPSTMSNCPRCVMSLLQKRTPNGHNWQQ